MGDFGTHFVDGIPQLTHFILLRKLDLAVIVTLCDFPGAGDEFFDGMVDKPQHEEKDDGGREKKNRYGHDDDATLKLIQGLIGCFKRDHQVQGAENLLVPVGGRGSHPWNSLVRCGWG